MRTKAIALDKATNYGVVRIELLEHLYETLYTQNLRYKSEEDHPMRLLNHRTVERVEDLPDNRVRLHIHNSSNDFLKARSATEETIDVDLVIVAAGYERDVHEEILKSVRGLMPGGGVQEGQRWSVGRDYRVNFEQGAVAEDAGIYLQGCNEKTHGVSFLIVKMLSSFRFC